MTYFTPLKARPIKGSVSEKVGMEANRASKSHRLISVLIIITYSSAWADL